MATRHVLAQLTLAAADTGLPRATVESVGGVDAAQRVAAAEQFDLVFLAHDAIAWLADQGHVDAASITPLLLSQTAAAVPSDTDDPATPPAESAFTDLDSVRSALRGATAIGYSTGPSGDALTRMIDDWGMTTELEGRLVQALPGIPVARLLAEGKVDLGFQQLSELVDQPGVRILGVLPPECGIDTVFSGAVATTAAERTAARDVLAFLASDAVVSIKTAHSFEIPGRNKSEVGDGAENGVQA